MKAYQILKYGQQEPLVLNEIETPVIDDDGILVAVHGASLNPVDTKIRSGAAKRVLRYAMPLTLGHDFAGEIVAIGKNVSDYKCGDSVYGRTPRTGSFQEFVSVTSNDIALIPTTINRIEAAAYPLVSLTAYQGIFQWLDLQPGQSILITGGSGGVGHIAIQLALNLGATVYTTASPEGIEFLDQFAGIHFIDYTKEDYSNSLKDLDAVFDMRGKDDVLKAMDCVKVGGRVVSIATLPTPSYAMVAKMGKGIALALAFLNLKIFRKARKKGITFHAFLTQSNHKQLYKISEAIDEGVLKATVDEVVEPQHLNQALNRLEKGRVKGKIVVDFEKEFVL